MGKKTREKSKSERLIYVVIFLWIIFGILGIYYETNLVELAGYYVSLSMFVGTYFWGEYKRTSTESKLLEKGPNSIRETTIYITILLWLGLGIYGIFKKTSMNDLTVYFAALSPFVSSFIIYKTSKGDDVIITSNVDDTPKDINVEVDKLEDNIKKITVEINDNKPDN